jgi:diaminopimelate epimerase
LIPFTKAQACGNDFLIVTEEAAGGGDRAGLARRLCARSTGVGADGIEFFQWTGPGAGRIRLYNADGSMAEISGNGTRTVAAWMAEASGAEPGDRLSIETDAGLRVCSIQAIDREAGYSVEVSAGMGVPSFERGTVCLRDGTRIAGAKISMGNPHLVLVADDDRFSVSGRPWEELGAEIATHPDFPHQTNVEFLRIVRPDEIALRIFERGVGPTLSSGTGSSAAAVAAIALEGCSSPLKVVAPGGAQTVEWTGPGAELTLNGPATLVARGEAW